MAEASGRRESRLRAPLIGGFLLSAAMLACYAVLWGRCVQQTEGHFIYALDDPYIHLAIAKNFAEHGVWGVTQYANASACSSPLWALVLAFTIRIMGESTLWPFIFGVACSVAATLLIYARLLRAGLGTVLAFAAGVGAFAIGPQHILPFTGMEHSLQILLDVLFGFWLMDALSRDGESKAFWRGLVLTTLMCLCRYESVFLLVVPVGICLWRRDWRLAAALCLGPVIGIGGFGLASHVAGMPWVPNSILLKGNLPHTSGLDYLHALALRTFRFLHAESLGMSDLFLLAVLAGIALRTRGLREKTVPLQTWLWTVVVACLLHSAFAAVGYFYRYEAYLLVLLFTVVVLALREIVAFTFSLNDKPVNKLWWLLSIGFGCAVQVVLLPVIWFYQLNANLIISTYLILAVGLISMEVGVRSLGKLLRTLACTMIPLILVITVKDRAGPSFLEISGGSRDIYLQQIQMARFVARYYNSGRLGVNDIGAVSYFTHVHLLDLVGLASDDVRRLKVARKFSTATLAPIIERFQPDLIIAYPDWFTGPESLPPSLIPVATWVIPPQTTAGGSLVMFYARNSERADELRQNLIAFQSSLPVRVLVQYLPSR